MSQHETLIHLAAGGIAGTAGAVVTCPLEVVKTRLQSSNPAFGDVESRGRIYVRRHSFPLISSSARVGQRAEFSTSTSNGRSAHLFIQHHHAQNIVQNPKLGILQCLKLIVAKEGVRGLFKGLGPNLVGVAPSRAIYFCSYSRAKNAFNKILPTESPVVHICSAATAGFVACTTTNPVWFVKTRLQLHNAERLSTREIIKRIYVQGGPLGFYKGISASYMGISETVIHFVIYEAVKKELRAYSHSTLDDADRNSTDFLQFMCAGAISKTVASCIAYPHEVARTRLREEGSKYKSFWQTLALVVKEEGPRGVYRGLATQLLRQIPNTAIMMSTYEAAVYLFGKYSPSNKPELVNKNVNAIEEIDESFYNNKISREH